MRSHADIIELFGNANLARRIGVGEKRVEGWKRRSSIPVVYFEAVIAAARDLGIGGVTADLLVALAARKTEEPAA